MGSVALLQSLKESILGQASVKTIYGEPISAHGKDDHPSGKNNVWLRCGCGHGRRGRYQRSRRRRWWRRRSAGRPRGRDRGERAADPVCSDYGSKKADWGCAGGDWIWYVGGVAQTTPTLICGAVVDNGARRTCGAKAETHFNAFSGTTEAVPLPNPILASFARWTAEGGSADGRCSSSGVRYVRLPATPVYCRQAYQLESAIGVSLRAPASGREKKQLLVGFQRLKVRRSSRVPTTS